MTTIADVRRFMEAAAGKLTPAKAQELARSLKQGQGKEQVTKAAHELLEWSNKNRERIAALVRTEVRSQLASIGVASKDEVDALKKRVRELERRAPAKRATAKRSPAKRGAAKRTTRRASEPSAPAEPAAPPAPSTPASAPTGGGA